MITVQKAGQGEQHREPMELETLRVKINDRRYLYEAIESLALILSNEILNIHRGGIYEWEGRN
ncbi:MAG: hypothetical protein LBQ30_07060 [Treponema sp.]|jgi:hypothetical protein|nr:hypothetical protein [Treponema sp.]